MSNSINNNVTNSMIHAAASIDQASYKKTALETWTRARKIEKLAFYSACQYENCKCNGWKNPAVNVNEHQVSKNVEPICKTCSHIQSEFRIKFIL